MANNNRLGELLVREKLISLSQLRHAQDEQQKSGSNLGYTLAKLGYVSDDEITSFLSPAVPRPDDQPRGVRDRRRDPQARAEGAVREAQGASRSRAPATRSSSRWPTRRTSTRSTTSSSSPATTSSRSSRARPRSTTPIEKYYNAGPSYDEVMAGFDEKEIEFTGDEDDVNLLELEKASEDAPVVRLVNMILLNAIKKGASDIHIEPYEKKLRVRYRIDGVLAEEMTPPLKLKNAIIEPHQDHGVARHRRAAPPAGRAHQAASSARAARWTSASRSCRRSGARRSSCGSSTRANLQLDMTKLGFDAEAARRLHVGDRPALGHGARHRAHGLGQDDDALLGALRAQQDRAQHLHRGGSRSSTTCTASTRCRCTTRSASTSRARCARSSGRTRTSSWSARSATSRPRRSRSRRRSPATWCSRRCTPTTRPATISRLLNMGVEPFLITASVNLVLAQRLARKICAGLQAADRRTSSRCSGLRVHRRADRHRQAL